MSEINARFYSVGTQGQISLLHQYDGWRKTWHSIVPMRFNSGFQYNLLFYDRIFGMGRIYQVGDKGQMTWLKDYTGWSKSWDVIVPFGQDATSELLFYDRAAGVARFYSVDASGNLSLLQHHSNWRRSWDILASGFFAESPKGLFLYDRTEGDARLFTVNGGALTAVRTYTDWKKTWDVIVPGKFLPGEHASQLLLYRRVVGDATILSLDYQGDPTALKHYTNWRKTWDLIMPGRFHSFGQLTTDILCYDRSAGRGEFVSANQQDELATYATHTNWRKSWSSIVVGRVDSGNLRDDVLFYDNTFRLRLHAVKCADDDGQRDTAVTPTEFAQWVARANITFARAGIAFEFDPASDWEVQSKTAFNDLDPNAPGVDSAADSAEKAANHTAAGSFAEGFPGKIVVFLRYGFHLNKPTGQGVSGDQYKFVMMPPFLATYTDVYHQDGSKDSNVQNIKLLGHELGHYLGLEHTFVKIKWTDNDGNPVSDPDVAVLVYLKAKGLKTKDALDYDRNTVRDTPPDVRLGYFTLKGWNPADLSKEVTISSPADGISFSFNPDRHNLMSYSNCDDVDRLSPDQVRLMREFLFSANRKHLIEGQL